MSNKLYQGIVNQIKNTVERNVGVMDENGTIIACSELYRIGMTKQDVRDEMTYSPELLHYQGYTYMPIVNTSDRSTHIIFVDGEDAEAEKIAGLLSITLGSVKTLYDEKYDRASFVKNVILDNILPSDIYLKSKELHFMTDVRRIVMLIKIENPSDVLPYQVVQNMFPDKESDYVISLNEAEVVLVKQLSAEDEIKDVELIAQSIIDTFNGEFLTKANIGIGTEAKNIQDLAKSYKEAQISLEVGKVFDNEKDIISYDYLGIGRLVYQMPTTLCELFLSEVFRNGSYEALDSETLTTIQCFFENNLNVSETARKLFVHRNTLVYRLDKVYKITGLDLREFDDSIIFKVAMMVKKYLSSKPVRY